MSKVSASAQVPIHGAGEPIDRAYIARFTLGNAVLEREILELFATQLPLYLQQLRTATTRQGWKDAAHAIKGSALAIGAQRLAALARAAEQVEMAADGATSEGDRDRAITAVTVAAHEVCRYIAGLLATP